MDQGGNGRALTVAGNQDAAPVPDQRRVVQHPQDAGITIEDQLGHRVGPAEMRFGLRRFGERKRDQSVGVLFCLDLYVGRGRGCDQIGRDAAFGVYGSADRDHIDV